MNTGFEIWIARCAPGPGQMEPPTAAVWADSAETCERTLRNKIIERGLEWIGLEQAVPLEALDDDARRGLPLEGLRDALNDAQPVVFRRGQFMRRLTAQHVVTPLPFTAPLDMQMDTHPKLNVPDDLRPHLFPDGMNTYAVLDAGHILGLPDMLSSSGLRNMCLYTGALAADARDLAPYLVALSPDARLTRQLMTQGDGPRDFWPLDYGLFITTRMDFDTAYAHFRKFTSVEDQDDGARLYFRFWSNAVMRAFARHSAPDPLISSLIGPCTLIFRDMERAEGTQVLALSLEAPS